MSLAGLAIHRTLRSRSLPLDCCLSALADRWWLSSLPTDPHVAVRLFSLSQDWQLLTTHYARGSLGVSYANFCADVSAVEQALAAQVPIRGGLLVFVLREWCALCCSCVVAKPCLRCVCCVCKCVPPCFCLPERARLVSCMLFSSHPKCVCLTGSAHDGGRRAAREARRPRP